MFLYVERLFLCNSTGSEAMFADLGHFSVRSIQVSLLTYFSCFVTRCFVHWDACELTMWYICNADKLQLSRISSFTLSLQWPSCLSHKIP